MLHLIAKLDLAINRSRFLHKSIDCFDAQFETSNYNYIQLSGVQLNMKSSNTLGLSVLFSLALAGVGFVITYFLHNDSALTLAIGIAIGGLAVTSLPSKTPSTEENFTTKTLYVGNLPYRANEASVRQLFSEHGRVVSVRLMKDKQTGKRRGFGFVEMPDTDADAAILALNEKEFQQRTLKVREANERTNRENEFDE